MEQLGPYVLEARIARGGMGEIYRASLIRSGGFQRTVAVKRILPHLSDDATFIRMFETEARLTALLNHPNIVHMYDFGRHDGTVWLAMEFVDGVDVRRLFDATIAAGEKFPLSIALHIAEQCARGLHYAHTLVDSKGPLRIVHRDISPQNILLSAQGETKLTDFGLAKALAADPGSMSGMMKGKLGYMSPEQVQGAAITPQTDIFGLGAVLYELVSGRRLYPVSEGLAALVARATQARIDPLSTEDAPGAVCEIIGRCLKKNPAERFSSADELASELSRIVSEYSNGSAAVILGQLVEKYRTACNGPHHFLEAPPVATAVAARPARELVSQPVDEVGDSDAGIRGSTDASRNLQGFELAETVVGPPLTKPGIQQAESEPSMPVTAVSSGDLKSSWISQGVRGWVIGSSVTLIMVALVISQTMSPRIAPSEPSKESRQQESIRVGANAQLLPAAPRFADLATRRRERRVQELTQAIEADAVQGRIQVNVSGVEQAECFAWSELRQQQRSLQCGVVEQLPAGPWRILAKTERGDRTENIVVIAGQPTDAIALHWATEPIDCELRINSTPPGAALSIDGTVSASATPSTTTLTPGEHTLRIDKRGWDSVLRRIECNSEPLQLDVELKRLRYTVTVGNRRKRISPGASKRWPITRTDGGRATLRVRLTASGSGSVVMDASPYAQVYVNGVSRGVTPIRGVRVPVGKRTIFSLKRDGKRIGRTSVFIQADTEE
jgi:serine/threonine protein kinase